MAATVQVGALRMAYESFGDSTDPPVLLIMGLGTQMLGWPDEFCHQLADRHLRVIRFDNRDIGLSTHLDGIPVPSPVAVYLRRQRSPYSVADMADDAAGLLRALSIDAAHVVGASLGGFIAQELVIRHPEMVRTLTLIMTSTGNWKVGRTKLRVMAAVLRRRTISDRAEAIEASVATHRLIGSPGFELDENRVRDASGRSYDRAFDPAGVRRQLAAVAGQRDRTGDLGRLSQPTLVVHGLADPLVSVSGGLALARTIPGAKFVGYPGMGHDLPQPLWADLIAEVSTNITRGPLLGQPLSDMQTDAVAPDSLAT